MWLPAYTRVSFPIEKKKAQILVLPALPGDINTQGVCLILDRMYEPPCLISSLETSQESPRCSWPWPYQGHHFFLLGWGLSGPRWGASEARVLVS